MKKLLARVGLSAAAAAFALMSSNAAVAVETDPPPGIDLMHNSGDIIDDLTADASLATPYHGEDDGLDNLLALIDGTETARTSPEGDMLANPGGGGGSTPPNYSAKSDDIQGDGGSSMVFDGAGPEVPAPPPIAA